MPYPGYFITFNDDGAILDGFATARNQQGGFYAKDVYDVFIGSFSEGEIRALNLLLLDNTHSEDM